MSLKRRLIVPGVSLAALMAAAPAVAGTLALPTGGQVAKGQATFGQAGSALTVTQSSQRAVINWSSFNVGKGASVQFNNGNGVTLNRVTGPGGSFIAGQLNATGSIFLLNPAGVIIAPGGQVFVGGSFAASTLALSDSAFMAGGALTLSGTGGQVVNLGSIRSAGGDIVLAAPVVQNAGDLSAPNGEVALVAGSTAVFDPGVQGKGRYTATDGSATDSVTNTGAISAAEVELRAHAGDIYALAVGTGGEIDATGVSERDGSVYLISDLGKVVAHTTISASGPGPSAGLVETSGATVDFTGLKLHARNWLVDPDDLTVDANAASTIAGILEGGTDVTLQTTASTASGPGNITTGGLGDININAPFGWDTANTLTLNAYHSVIINAAITVAGPGNLVINTNAAGTDGVLSFGLTFTGAPPTPAFKGSVTFADNDGSLTINGTPYTLLFTFGDFINLVSQNTGGAYALAGNLDQADYTTGSLSNAPIAGSQFTGQLNGLGHVVTNLSIAAGEGGQVGLIQNMGAGASVASIGISGGAISGSSELGLLAGAASGHIYETYATGTVTPQSQGSDAGGLVGFLTEGGSIASSYSTAAVTGGFSAIGGLVGHSDGTITGSAASGAVTGSADPSDPSENSGFGGLVGVNTSQITNSSSSGEVIGGSTDTGGLVGLNSGTISGATASGPVAANPGSILLGGLVGENQGGIDTSSASGAVTVTGGQAVGGLVGQNDVDATISNSSSSSVVLADATSLQVGGLVGNNFGQITAGAATGAVTGGANATGGLVGVNQSGATISGSSSSGAVSAAQGAFSVGGLVGDNAGSIDTSTSASAITVTGTTQGVGGLVGTNEEGASISGVAGIVTAAGSITADTNTVNVGGLVGLNMGTVTNASSSTSITGGIGEVGGLVGLNNEGGSISGSTASGPVTPSIGAASIGGLVGQNNGSIDTSTATNIVTTIDTASAPDTQVGGLVGNNGGMISGVAGVVTAAGSVVADTNTQDVGGLVGSNTGSITAASSSASVTGGAVAIGGLVGMNQSDAMISGSRSSGVVTSAGAYIGGLVGANAGTITDSSATGNVTATAGASDVGGLVGWSTGSIKTNTTPSLTFATGNVSVSGTVLNAGGLVGLNDTSGTITGVYATGSVTTTDTTSDFDGGLVGRNQGSITNSQASGRVTSNAVAGGLVGYNSGSISVSSASGGVVAIGSFDSYGGLVGEATGSIMNSSATGSVTNTSSSATSVGGLVGQLDVGGSISNSTANVAISITAGDRVGGLVGLAFSGVTITGSSAAGALTVGANTQNVGGLVGEDQGATTTSSSASGAVTGGGVNIGGLIGISSGSIMGSHATGSVTGGANASGVGGLVGQLQAPGSITDSYAQGNVAAPSGGLAIGGLVGLAASGATITGSNASGVVTVSASVANVGGLVGEDDGARTSSSSAIGSIFGGASDIGGLIGESKGSVSTSFATGEVSGGSASTGVGGLVGAAYGTISNSYAKVPVTGYSGVGGLVGDLYGSVSNSYSTGEVTGAYAVGGLIGGLHTGGPNPYPQLTNSFYDASVVLVNGGFALGAGAMYDSQYQDWFNNNFTLSILKYFGRPDSNGFYSISSASDLQNLLGFAETSGLKFKLTQNIDLSSAPGLFTPYFAGTLDGQGFVLSNVAVDAPSEAGGVVGVLQGGAITNLGVTGTVTGQANSGGVVGDNFGGAISNSWSAASVTGRDVVGGFVGVNYGTISTSFALGPVTVLNEVYNCCYVGGFVGLNGASITYAYAMGSVSTPDAAANTSYTYHAGGFAGENDATVTQAYATGVLSGVASNVVARGFSVNTGTLSSADYDASTTGLPLGTQGSGAVGLTTAALQGVLPAGFAGDVWSTGPGLYPYLTQLPPARVVSGFVDLTPGTPAVMAHVAVFDGGVSADNPYQTSTGANGYYYAFIPVADPGATSAVGVVMAPASATAPTGGAFSDAAPTLAGTVPLYSLNMTSGQVVVATGTSTLSALQAEANATFGAATYANLLSGLSGDTWSIQASGPFTVDQSFNEAGMVQVQSGGDLGIVSGGSLTSAASGDAVVLAANGSFSNTGGSQAVSTPNGAFLIYSQATGSNGAQPPADSFGGLAGQSWYGDAYNFTTGLFAGATGPGSRFVYGYQPTVTIAAVTGSSTYNAQVQTDTYTVSGLVNGDTQATALSGTVTGLSTSSKNAGAYPLTPAGLTSPDNYAIAYQPGTFTITPFVLTLTAVAASKTYDGTTAANVSSLTDNHLAGDQVSDTFTAAAFADPNAGANKTVTLSGLGLSGADAKNYALPAAVTTTASISPRPITVAADPQTGTSGSAIPPLTFQLTTGALAGDDSFSGGLATTATIASPAGIYPITQGSLSAGSNYALTFVGANLTLTLAQTPAQIAPPITVTSVAAFQNLSGDLAYGGLTDNTAAALAAQSADSVDQSTASGKNPTASPALPTPMQFIFTSDQRWLRRSTTPITQTNNGDQLVGGGSGP